MDVVSYVQRRTNKMYVLQGQTATQFIKFERTKDRFIQQVETQKSENISCDTSLVVYNFGGKPVILWTKQFISTYSQ